MTRFANLSGDARRQLQARLYHARKRTRDARIAADAPLSLSGAALGVLGSEGSLPTGWSISSTGNLNIEVVSLETLNDYPSLSIRVNGLNDRMSYLIPTLSLPSQSAVDSAEYELSYLGVLKDATDTPDGGLPGIPISDSIFGFLNADFVDTNSDAFTTSLDRIIVNKTVPNPVFSDLDAGLFRMYLDIGETVDVTIQIADVFLRRIG